MSDSASIPLPKLSRRRPDSNTGDFGKVVLVGGSRGMAGSIALSGKAAPQRRRAGHGRYRRCDSTDRRRFRAGR